MKLCKRIIAIVIASLASILLLQFVIKKLYHRWSGTQFISLYDEEQSDRSPHPHISAVQRRFLG